MNFQIHPRLSPIWTITRFDTFKHFKTSVNTLKYYFSRKNLNFHINYKIDPIYAHIGQFLGRYCKILHKIVLKHFELKPMGTKF